MTENHLDRIVSALERPPLPVTADYWGVSEIAQALKYTPKYVREKVVTLEGFPRPKRVGGGHPRWRAVDVLRWVDTQV